MNTGNIGLISGGLTMLTGMVCMGTAPSWEYMILAGACSVMGAIIILMGVMSNDK